MITYKLVKDFEGNVCSISRSDGWSIPLDLANTDYQAYLKWVEAGGVPEAADEPA
jgi:hypothetical protein